MDIKPLCIDLFAGLGGWTEGFLSEGYGVVGFDLERHDYGTGGYPAQLVLQDVLTLHGSQFRNAACIVASPPCQRYSYMAMPWSRAKELAKRYRENIGDLNDLFNACFRIQLEASQAAGRHIPLVVENAKGAQPWVGRAKANYGSFYLWGDVESVGGRIVASGPVQFGMPAVRATGRCQKVPGFCFDGSGGSFQTASVNATSGVKYGDRNPDGKGWSHSFADSLAHNTESGVWHNPVNGVKRPGMNWSGSDKPGYKAEAFNKLPTSGTKQGGEWWHDPDSITQRTSSRSHARKAASAEIAKIPFPLSQHIARCFKTVAERTA